MDVQFLHFDSGDVSVVAGSLEPMRYARGIWVNVADIVCVVDLDSSASVVIVLRNGVQLQVDVAGDLVQDFCNFRAIPMLPSDEALT